MTNRSPRGALAALCLAAAAPMAAAQSLTPEELRALIDERVEGMNPYQELLNDPDPERSLAAVEIMMASGDPQLVRMAREFGMTAADPQVRRVTLEAYLATQPVLSVRFDGTGLEDTVWARNMRQVPATVDSEMIATLSSRVGAFDPNQGCYVHYDDSDCFVVVGFDGVELSGRYYTAKGALAGEGRIAGSANLHQITQAFPFSIQLLD